MFNSLHESGHYPTKSSLAGVRRIKLTKSEMGYLIVQLLAQLDGDNLLAVKLCLATGTSPRTTLQKLSDLTRLPMN
ncbi:hypothetical protein [Salmonella enterica]